MSKPGPGMLNMVRLFVVIAACADLSVVDSLAQHYPVKPIRIVVGYGAGGGADVTARMVGQKLSEHLGQPVVVENRLGASGSIATARVAASPADGYTLLMAVSGDTVLPALRAKLPYDLERDFAPVSLVTIGPYLLVVHPSVPARNARDLITLARSRPGKLNYGSAGVGGGVHLAGELFKLMAKVNIVHVPYKGGSAESVIAVAVGQIDISFPNITAALPLLEARKVRSLAVTSAKRASLMPSIPTLDESGLPGYDRSTWYGLLAPAGVPKVIIAQLHAVIDKVVNAPEMKESFNKQGAEPQTNTPEQFAALIRSELAQNASLVKLAGLKVE